MKILFLNYEYPPLGGGAGNATYHLLKEFSSYPSLKIHLITSSTKNYYEQQFSPNIRIFFVNINKKGSLHHQSYKNLVTYSWKSYLLAKKLNKEQCYDLTHAFFGVPCGCIAMKLKMPYIVSLRGSDVPNHNPKLKKIYSLLNRQIRQTWINSQSLIVNSASLKEEAKKFLPLDFKIIPNGIDTDYFQPGKKQDDIFRVLFVGRLHQIKSIDLLIREWNIFLKNNPKTNAQLLLVGEGPEQEKLKRLGKELKINSKNLLFHNYCNKNKVRDYYQQSSVFALISKNEGMNNALLEAMACGLPIITTKTGDAELLIKNNGFVIENTDANLIAKIFSHLKNNPQIITEMGQRSREIARKLSWSDVAKKYYETYQNI